LKCYTKAVFKDKGSNTYYNTAYTSQNSQREMLKFTIFEVMADWHMSVTSKCIIQSFIAHISK